MKKPTIKDVAARACVSAALVSRVMNAPMKDDGLPDCVVHPDTARRILKAIADLGYHPNKAAVSLRKVLKKRIGVIIPDIANQFFADIAKNIESLARHKGYIVLFGSTNDNSQQLDTLAEAFMEDGVDGIIVVPGVNCYPQVHKLVSQGIPVVLAIRDIPNLPEVSRVLDDNVTATEIAIEHLLDKGFQNIDMISPIQRISTAQHRENLFTIKMESLGLNYKIHHEDPGSGLDDIRLILENALRRNVQALYCASASIPLRLLEVCREMNINIPDDIAIIGYDGGPNYNLLSPSISQIEFSREEIAKNAFDELMQMIARDHGSPQTILIKPRLIQAASTDRSKPKPGMLDEDSTAGLLSALSKAQQAISSAISELQ